jgi:SPP1 gp7 family putative phage head morphogenesis protein
VRPYLLDLRDLTRSHLHEAARVSALVMDAADAPGRAHRAIEAARKELDRRWSPKRLAEVVHPVGIEVDRLSKRNVAKAMRLPVASVPEVARVPEWAKENARLIVTVADRHLAQVGELVAGQFKAGARWEDVSKALEERYDVAKSNAERIARTETSKLNAAVTKERFVALGVTEAIWRTVRDERVRESHADLEGERYSLAEGGPGGLYPGSEPCCRCWAEPIVEI